MVVAPITDIERGFSFEGEHGPTLIIDRCLSEHRFATLTESDSIDEEYGNHKDLDEKDGILLSNNPDFGPPRKHYGSLGWDGYGRMRQTVRFQVVVWYVGNVDVLQGRVTMKFRVTLFWNDDSLEETEGSDGTNSERPQSMWTMQGRHKASERALNESDGGKTVDIPAVSILNAVTFDVIGEPEVALLRESTNLMRWTALYKATLIQENMRVDKFPHDEHDLYLKLGILSKRKKGSRWDSNTWKLSLATEEDSQRSTRIPYGLLVDHVKIPEFSHDPDTGLVFDFVPLGHGVVDKTDEDQCLEVKLHVWRDSSYYDKNIVPILGLLDLVAASFLFLDATSFFQRGLMTLNIAFLEIGIRMTVDSYLPNVGYQIKLQNMLNMFFFRLIFLTLESSLVYVLVHNHGWSIASADIVDEITAAVALSHSACTLLAYYRDKHRTAARMPIGKVPS